MDGTQRAQLDEMLEIPLNTHPLSTPKAKKERAAFFQNLKEAS